MAEPRTSLNQELTALSECFKKAELNYGKIPNQPSQINAQKQLHKLLKLIFASKEFVTKLTLCSASKANIKGNRRLHR
jgi:hypothetical protein